MEQRTHPIGMWALLHPFVLRCVLFFVYVEGFEPTHSASPNLEQFFGKIATGASALAMTWVGRERYEKALVYVILSEVRSTKSKNLGTIDSA